MSETKKVIKNTDDEVSLKELLLFVSKIGAYLRVKWLLLTICTVIGIIIGILYAKLSTPKYIAKTTFVLDEGTPASIMPALSGLSAFGLGGGIGGSLFSGENLIWLYSSNRMIRETLLTEVKNENGHREFLIDGFIRIDKKTRDLNNDLRNKITWSATLADELTKGNLNRNQNKILNAAVQRIREGYLKVATEDKAEGIIGVTFESTEELYSLNFVNEIVDKVNRFYINTKTKKTSDRVEVLQRKVKEFNAEMKQSMNEAAFATDAVPDANPNLQYLRVQPQKEAVDVQVNSSIYVNMVQQLEAAKIAMAKETPLIQVVDQPMIPLKVVKPSTVISVIVGGGVFLLGSVLMLLGRKFVASIKK